VQPGTPFGRAALDTVRTVAVNTPPAELSDLRIAWIDSLLFPDILPIFMAQFGFNLHERHAEIAIVDLRSMPAGALWFPIDEQSLTPKALRNWIRRETRGDVRIARFIAHIALLWLRHCRYDVTCDGIRPSFLMADQIHIHRSIGPRVPRRPNELNNNLRNYPTFCWRLYGERGQGEQRRKTKERRTERRTERRQERENEGS
jgi:hypothetical protein